MLSYLGLAEAGLWAAKVNDSTKTVLVIKLGTDTLKWIQRGVPVNLLIGHAQIENALIRVIGLEVFDCKTNPLLPNLPQVEKWEIENFDSLLTLNRFSAHFHNEQPFLSILDATGSLPQEAVQAYLKKRASLRFHTSPVPAELFRTAQDAFKQALAKKPAHHVDLFSFPLSIKNPVWNSIGVPDAGTFVPDDSDEGKSHEALLLHVLKPNFDGTVRASPQINDGDKARELCDVLAIAGNAFLFEAKAFSVFEKSFDQSSDRKAATVMKHFEKALGQLQGAVKRLEQGVTILGNGLPEIHLDDAQFQALHGIIVVSNTNFDLPWLEIGKQLADAQRPPRIFYHFVPLVEIQRMVAFAQSSSEDLSSLFVRRAEIIAQSKDAHIDTDYRPEVTSSLRLPAVPANYLGLRFAWIGEKVVDWLLLLFPAVYRQFLAREFSGRVDVYHRMGRLRGVPAIGLGLAACPTSGQLSAEWWSQLRTDLFNSFKDAGLPPVAANSDAIQTLGEITAKFSELLLAIEFEQGRVVAKRPGEGM